MLEFRGTAETTLSPEEVITGAYDFSEQRAEIWPNVKKGHFEVHEAGDRFADVTEKLPPAGVWERGRYEREPGLVKHTVTDSNALEPGSTWELRAVPIEGGSRVETVYRRNFKPTIRGRYARVINTLGGRLFARSDLRRALSAIEKRS